MKFLRKARLLLFILITLLLALPHGVQAAIVTDGIYGVDHPLNAGDVYLFKTVEEVPGSLNTFRVTLHVESKDDVKSNDIVLVIDTSGSMAGSRMTNAKAAATQFVNEMLVPEQPLTRIALVSFESTATTEVQFTNNKTTLINAINGLYANGGTFTQAGVRQACNLLASSTADSKNIVLLSDGEPTFSYGIYATSRDQYLIPFDDPATGEFGEEISTAVNENAFSTSRVGTGNRLRQQYERAIMQWNTTAGDYLRNYSGDSPLYIYQNGNYVLVPSLWATSTVNSNIREYVKYYPNTTYYYQHTNGWYYYSNIETGNINRYSIYSPARYYNNGHSAIAEAGFAKNSGYTMHTIALGAGAVGTPILNQMASPGNAYDTTDPTALSGIFAQIAASLSAAVNNASISDMIGTGFTLAFGDATNLQPSQGTAAYNQQTNTLTWDIGNLTQPVNTLGGTFATVDSLVKYAQLKYDVVLDDTILDLDHAADGYYDVNRNAGMTYTDINGDSQTATFPVPKAKPVIVELRKELRDSQGNLITADTSVANRSLTSEPGNRQFNFHVALRDTPTSYKNYLMNGTSSRVMTDLRVDNYYTITEDHITGAVIDNFADYDTTIRWQTWDGTRSSGEPSAGTSFTDFQVPRDGNDDPLNTTFTIVNKEKPLGVLTLTKHLDLGEGQLITELSPDATHEFILHVTGPYGYSQEVRIKAGETKTLENLVYGEYTVVETPEGGANTFNVTYTDSYGDTEGETGTKQDGKVKLSFNKKAGNVTVLNTVKDGDKYTNFVAQKTWIGGSSADHTAVTLDLYRNGQKYTVPAGVTLNVSGPDTSVLGQTTYTYTWNNLFKYRLDGGLSIYTVREQAQTQFYAVTYSADNTVVYNTYNPALNTTDVRGDKVWVGGGNVRPDIYFTLYRRAGTEGNFVQVPGSTVQVTGSTYTWQNQEVTDGGGVAYQYAIMETNASGIPIGTNTLPAAAGQLGSFAITGGLHDAVPADGTLLTITNTYVAPKNGTATGTKVWSKGPAARPDIYLALYRTPQGGSEEPVPTDEAPVQLLSNGQSSVAWNNLTQANVHGSPYTFTVYEMNKVADNTYTKLDENAQWSYTANGVEHTYAVTYTNNHLTVNNTYVPVMTMQTAEKIWQNGPATRPEIGFTLYRHLDGTAQNPAVDAVTGAPQKRVPATEPFTVAWDNMRATDDNGTPYHYYIREVWQEGTYTPGVPPVIVEGPPTNYTVIYNDAAMTATNTYAPPKEDQEATKTWIGGSALTRPTTHLQLMRRIGAGNWEAAPDATPIKIADGDEVLQAPGSATTLSLATATVTFPNVETHNISGVAYEFAVREVENKGTDAAPDWQPFTPEDYTKLEHGMGVTNYYNSPLVNKTFTKTWNGTIQRPAVVLTLQRKSAAQGAELETPVQFLTQTLTGADDTEAATWTGLPERDGEGYLYTYSVKETYANLNDPNNDNWTVTYSADGMSLTNTPITPDGTLTITKNQIDNSGLTGGNGTVQGTGEQLTFTFTVTGPNGYAQTVEVKAGKSETLTGLYYGEYTVVETETHDFEPSYQDSDSTTAGGAADGVVVLTSASKAGTVTVTNANTADTQVAVMAQKKWVNGNSADYQAPTFNLKRGTETVTADVTPYFEGFDSSRWYYAWTGLPKYDQNGYAYNYTVEEDGVVSGIYTTNGREYSVTSAIMTPENQPPYTLITNTYKAPTADQEATKVWENGENYNNGVRPTVWFQLWRKVEGGAAAPVPGAEVKALPHNTTAVTWENMPTTDNAARLYTYTVKEVRNAGTLEAPNWVDYTPDNYTKAESGMTVTNTFVIPTEGVATAKKVWVNGPSQTAPPLTLWRRLVGSTAAPDEVTATPVVVPVGSAKEFNYTWSGLEQTDTSGTAYEFFFTEDTSILPQGYAAAYSDYITVVGTETRFGKSGETVTNTYTPPTAFITLKKTFINPDNVTQPEVKLTLERKIAAETEWTALPITLTTDETAAGTAQTVHITDISGNPYTYRVTEAFTNPAPTDANWVATFSDTVTPAEHDNITLTATNSLRLQEFRKGKLTISKEALVNSGVDAALLNEPAGPQINFTVTVTDPYGNAQTHTLTPGGAPVVLNNLYFGQYTVEETGETHGYTAAYQDTDGTTAGGSTDGKVILTPDVFTGSVTITNTTAQTATHTVYKDWVNGPAADHQSDNMTLKLKQSGTEINLTPAVTDNVDGYDHRFVYSGLPRYSPLGRLYTYTAEEEATDGKITVNGNTYAVAGPTLLPGGEEVITNTYQVPTGDIKVTKFWSGTPEDKKIPVTVQLQKKVGTGNAVNDGAPVTIDGPAWRHTFPAKPLTADNGDPITYSVVETPTPHNFIVNYDGDQTDGFTVTNTWQTVDVSVTKQWVGGPAIAYNQPRDTKLTLKNGNTVVATVAWADMDKDATAPYPNEKGTYTFADLPKYDTTTGAEIPYTVLEEDADVPVSYTMTSNGDMENGFTITNTFNATQVKATKDYEPQTGPAVTFVLHQNGEEFSRVTLNGTTTTASPEPYEDDWTYFWPNLPSKVLKNNVVVDAVYTVTEDVPNNYQWQLTGDAQTGFTITNTYNEGTVTAHKHWDSNLPGTLPGTLTATRPAVDFTLYQHALDANGDIVQTTQWGAATLDGHPHTDTGVGQENASTLNHWSYTWENLPTTVKIGGVDYNTKYSVVEGEPPASGDHTNTAPEGYAVDTAASDSLQVTNVALTKAFTAEKVYVNGSKPPVTFTLYRKAGLTGTLQEVPTSSDYAVVVTLDGTPDTPDTYGNGELTAWKYTWNNLPRFSGTYGETGTEEYTYSVQETPIANYTAEYGEVVNNAQVVTNTYTIPRGDVTFTKTWDGGPRPDIHITLYRTPEGGTEAAAAGVTLNGVADGTPGKPRETTTDKDGEWTYIWPQRELTDIDGNWYTYRFVEAVLNDYTPSTPTAVALKDGNNVITGWETSITNTYASPETNALTATKKWVGGAQSEHTAPTLTLWRKTADMAVPEKVTTALDANFEADDAAGSTDTGTWTYTWQNVDTNRHTDGAPYTFYVTEAGVPNTYTLTFSNKETIGGTDYGKLVDNAVTLTNTYASPTVTLTLKKVFDNTELLAEDQPTVVLMAYRKAGTVTREAAVDTNGNPITLTTSVSASADFTVPVTDGDGNAYTYWVEETFDTVDVRNNNWKVEYAPADIQAAAGTDMELVVTNTLLPVNERTGKLTVKKAPLVNTGTNCGGATEPGFGQRVTFPFKVTNPYGTELTINMQLAPGGDAWEASGLLYGEYTVVETNTQGFTASYSPAGGQVTLTPAVNEATVTITNTSTDATKTSYTVTKKWVNGVAADHIAEHAPIYLYHDGVGNTQVKLPAASLQTETGQPGEFIFTWSNLAMYSPHGYKYVYGADEETDADGNITVNGRKYHKTISQDGKTITNKYVVPTTDALFGSKQWDLTLAGMTAANYQDIHKAKVDVWLQLWRTNGTVDEPASVGTTDVPQPVKKITVSDTDNTYIYSTDAWTNVATTDEHANPYSFHVKEVRNAGTVEAPNWVDYTPVNFVKSYGNNGQDKMTVVNKLDLKGTATLTKAKLVIKGTGSGNFAPQDDQVYPKRGFKFSGTGPYGFSREGYLYADVPFPLVGLAYGEYTIKEATEEGWMAVFEPDCEGITLGTEHKNITITNTIEGQNLKVTKNWVGGALQGGHPQPVFSLWQMTKNGLVKLTGAEAEYVKTAPADTPGGVTTQWVCTFKNIARYDEDGRTFTYYIFEEAVDNYAQTFSSPAKVGGITYAQPGSTITNTYSSPKAAVTATKEWDFSLMDAALYPNLATTAKVDVWFQLQRGTDGIDFSDVPGARLKVEAGTASVTWPDMPETDENGQTYIYAVREVDEHGTDYTPAHFAKSGGQGTAASPRDITLTNKMQPDTLTLTVKKPLLDNTTMNGGHAASASGQTGTPIAFTFKVIGPWGYSQTFTLTPGTQHVLSGLSAGEYTVIETNTQNYVPQYAPTQTVAVAQGANNTVTVTNNHASSNNPNAVQVGATKYWQGGASAEHTAVTMILSRSVNGVDFTDVTAAIYTVTPTTAGSSRYEYTWLNLPRHSPEGYPYTYRVREAGTTQDAEGKTILKVGDSIYDVTQDGNTVTNTFRVQYKELTGRKEWDFTGAAGLNVHAVDVWFQLYRKKPAGQEEVMPAAPVKMVANDLGTSYTWENEQLLPITDENGNVYHYYVKEMDENGVIGAPLNFTADSTDDLTITNTFNDVNDRKGKLTLRKARIDNSALPGGNVVGDIVGDNPLTFKFLVEGPYGYKKTVTLGAGQEITLDKLLYGEYTITETESHGYVPQYIPAGGKVNVLPGQLTPPIVEVKNNHAEENDPNTVSVRAFKQWEGYDMDKPGPLMLMRAPGTPNPPTMPLLSVGVQAEITYLGNNRYQYDWSNLPRHNHFGSPFHYTVTEPTYEINNQNYLMADGLYFLATYTTENDEITVTNTFQRPTSAALKLPLVLKELEGATLEEDQFTFALSVADTNYNKTAQNDADGKATFEDISFNAQGDYTITIREVHGGSRNYVYDNTVYTILVKARTDNNNALKLNTTFLKNGESYNGGDFVFTNRWEKDPDPVTSAPIEGRVELIGRALRDKEFEFQLLDGAGNVIGTARNGPDGSFSFGTQRFRREGTYVFTIRQVKGTEAGMQYDMDPIRVRITVREERSDGTGRILTARTSYTKMGEGAANDLLTNRIPIPPTGDKALVLPAVLLALSLGGVALWLLSKKRKEETV